MLVFSSSAAVTLFDDYVPCVNKDKLARGPRPIIGHYYWLSVVRVLFRVPFYNQFNMAFFKTTEWQRGNDRESTSGCGVPKKRNSKWMLACKYLEPRLTERASVLAS